jgi:hypothetical protein
MMLGLVNEKHDQMPSCVGLTKCCIDILTPPVPLFNIPKDRIAIQDLFHLSWLDVVFDVQFVNDLRKPNDPSYTR